MTYPVHLMQVSLRYDACEPQIRVRASDTLYVAEEEEIFVTRKYIGHVGLQPASSFPFQSCTRLRVFPSIRAITPSGSCGRNRTYSSHQHVPEGCWFRLFVRPGLSSGAPRICRVGVMVRHEPGCTTFQE